MSLFIKSIIVFITVEHVFFLCLEMFLWDKPLGMKIFRLTKEKAKITKSLAANQGLYNGFLAAGLLWGLITNGIQIEIFFLSCVAIAGIFGSITVNKRIFIIQSLPAIIALVLIFIS